jgi:ribonuclease Z
VFAKATGLPLETALQITRLAHTIPDQMGQILDMTKPRMGALWHMDVTPGVDAVFDEVHANYAGPVTVTQDLTIFNITKEAVVARQAKVDDAAAPVHGASHSNPPIGSTPAPPAWWDTALLDL